MSLCNGSTLFVITKKDNNNNVTDHCVDKVVYGSAEMAQQQADALNSVIDGNCFHIEEVEYVIVEPTK